MTLAWTIEHHPVVGSTMDVATERAVAGAPEGTIVVADQQTAGHGRSDRRWAAPAGSALLLTAILRPPLAGDRLGPLALVAGVAVAETIETVTRLPCWIKWPNDLWLGARHGGRKVGGILVSARLRGQGTEFVLLGIGLNVSSQIDDLPVAATSLHLELARSYQQGSDASNVASRVTRDDLLAVLLPRLASRYHEFVAADGRPALDSWVRRAALLHQPVQIVDHQQTRTGHFIGVRQDGALLLQSSQEGLQAIVAGDLVRGPVRVGEGRAVRHAAADRDLAGTPPDFPAGD